MTVMSLVATKNFLKFKEAIRCAYPKFTTTRVALTDRRDRQSMWFNNIQDLSLSSDFSFYFGHCIKWQCNSLLCCAPWTTFDTSQSFITFTKSFYASTTAPFTPSLSCVLNCDQVRSTGRFVQHMKKVHCHVDHLLDVLDLDQIHRPGIF